MGIKGRLVKAFMQDGNENVLHFALKLLGIDGGPGSGNWGHKGRPGQVGGSGKGGGTQYRGGRSDIGYYGSRTDWLNGLKGERQREAAKFIQRMREIYSVSEEELSKSAEQNIMDNPSTKYGGNGQRKKFLDFLGEARGWDKNANRLIQENWDETDRKIAGALGDKYGLQFVGGTALPDDTNAEEEWDAEDFAYWQNLKSKAMGGPVSDREASLELQYAAGVKERPSSTGWTKNVPDEKLDRGFKNLQVACGAYTDGTIKFDKDMLLTGEGLDDIESKAFKLLCSYGHNSSNVRDYLKIKLEGFGGKEYLQSEEAMQRLDVNERSALFSAIQTADNLNTNVLDSMSFVSSEERAKMFAIVNKALGGFDATKQVDDYYEEEKRFEEERKKRAEEERKKREEELARRREEIEKRREEWAKKRIEDLRNGETNAVQSAKHDNVRRVEVNKMPTQESEEAIIKKICGGDKTKGSCVSAAMAYVGNKFGFDVRDFRGGTSQSIFGKNQTLVDLAETPGVDGIIVEEGNDYVAAKKLLKNVEPGKEYIFTVGSHCSIVRANKDGTGYEYLELQTENGGWKPMEVASNDGTLKWRFGCKMRHSIYGMKVEHKSTLIEVEKLRGCQGLEKALPYLNTNESEQKKGVGGGAK